MTRDAVLTVGNPPSFRREVARAIGSPLEDVEWLASAEAAQTEVAGPIGAPDLVVLSPTVSNTDVVELAGHLADRAPATAVVVVRDGPQNGLLPVAMRAGVRDVVDLSRGNGELEEALKRALAWSSNLRSVGAAAKAAENSRNGHVFTVFSSKGGTGKTFLATNLALAIATQSGKDTALVDFDLKAGDVFSMFGSEPKRSLRDLVAAGSAADEAAIMENGREMAPHLWVYAAVPEPAGEPITAEAMTQTLGALRGRFDYVVIDGTDDYDDHVLAAFDMSDAICLITGLDMVGVRHLSRALDTMLSLGLPRDRFRMVLNRADSKVGLSPEDVERVLKLEVDAMIPSSRLVPTALNRGKPVFVNEPKSDVTKSLSAFAMKLLDATPVRKRALFGRA